MQSSQRRVFSSKQWLLGVLVILTGVLAAIVVRAESTPGYPGHWWAAVPTEGAPSWEILPQAAGPGEVILSKRHELGILSNFAATPFEYRGKRYASVEGFWQMMKFPEATGKLADGSTEDPRATHPGLVWTYTREQVAAMTAFEAKKAGDEGEKNMAAMGIDWVTFEGRRMEYRAADPGEHYRVIVEATWAKVRQNPEVRRALLSTGDLALRPDHRNRGTFVPEAWKYYELYMRIRAELKKEADHRAEVRLARFL